MKWLKRLLYIMLLLIAIVIAAPFIIPVNRYIPQIEKLASEKIHEPVRIGELGASFLPTPHLTLKGVSVGGAQDFRIDTIRVFVEILSLVKPVKVIKNIDLDGMFSNQDMLTRMPSWFKNGDSGPQRITIQNIRLHHVSVGLKKMTLGPFEGDIRLGNEGGFEQANIATEDSKLKMVIKPEKGSFRIEAIGKNWQPPVGPGLMFNELYILALANQNELDVDEINGNLYGGTIKGDARLSWTNGWRLSGLLHTDRVELKELVPLFSKETTVSGKLNADVAYLMKGETADQMVAVPSAEAKFRVKDGVLFNMDLVGAVRSFTSQGVRGGQTRFDEFSGETRLVNKGYHFRRLKIASGLLSASGDVSISPAKQLSGDISVQMKGTANLINVPLNVSGPLRDPVLRPTKSAVAGAVAGTAILGPGLGTSLGIKAGQMTENLFK